MKGAEILVESLIAHGVKYIFGVPGDTSLVWYEALHDHKAELKHILATDERNASFMADAYARITNRPGVCEGPSGGGVTYQLPGVSEANRSSIPLVSLNTGIESFFSEKGRLTEIDQQSIYKSETKWSATIAHAKRIPEFVRKAFRIATSGRPGAVHLAIPMDILGEEVDVKDLYGNPKYVKCPSSRIIPPIDDVKQAKDLILKAKRPVIIAGGGVHLSGAYEELQELAELVGIPVGTSITGKGSIPETHPLSIGCVGDNGGREVANEIVNESDLVIYLGTETGSVVTRKWTLPALDSGKHIIQIDIDPTEIGKNYPVDVGLVGDAKATLKILNQLIKAEINEKSFLERPLVQEISKRVAEWRKQEDLNFDLNSTLIKPQTIIKCMAEVLPQNSIIVSDDGTPTPFFVAYYEFCSAGRKYLNPRAHGALGYAVPGAVGACVASPESTIVALTGDGSMLMSMGELATISRLNLPVIVIIFHNNEYSWVKTSQALFHAQKFFSVDLPDIDYCKVAEGFGLRAIQIRDPNEVKPALRTALESEEPVVIDIYTEPLYKEIPPVAPWREAVYRERKGGSGSHESRAI